MNYSIPIGDGVTFNCLATILTYIKAWWVHLDFQLKKISSHSYTFTSNTMVKALIAKTHGGEFEVGEWERPVPTGHEILIKNVVVALNPIDWKLVSSSICLLARSICV